MVKIYPAQEITRCRKCPNHATINTTTGDMTCDIDDKPKHIIKYDNDYVPEWCKLPDEVEERLQPNQLTWEDRHPSNYKFEKVNVDQFLPDKE